MGVIHIYRKWLTAILCFILLLGASSPAAYAANTGLGQWLWWTEDGQAYHTFGGNAAITIHTGKMQVIPHCSPGTADGINAWTDLYIVKSGEITALSNGKELKDAGGGKPNTVMALSSGIFISETIGYTGPDGKIPPGEYAVVFDECQDGKFNYLIDGVIDPAFKVEYTTGVVPPLDLTKLKEDAGKEAKRWEKFKKYAEKLFALQKAADAGKNPNEKFVDFLMRSGLQDPRTMATLQLANQAKHYQGIADDPPDLDFQHVTPLGERPVVDLQSNQSLDLAMQSLANEAANEQAITRQLWTLLERYQGAQAVGNVNWALTHAMALSESIDLLLTQLQKTSQSANRFHQALSANGLPLNETAAELEQLRTRIASSGFTVSERQYFQTLGMTDADIAAFQAEFAAQDFLFAKNDMLAETAGIVTDYNAFGTNLVTFGSHIVDVINQLLQDPTVTNTDPTAKAGGPYTANEGVQVALNGTASASPAGITKYEWDLNGDGVFGEAQGAAVSHTFTKAFHGYVGLKVTDSNGKTDVDYAEVTVGEANRPPSISAKSPTTRQVQQSIGETRTFSVTASDPDSDPVTVQWYVNGAAAGTGNAFSHQQAQAGIYAVEAVASDTNPLGGAVRMSWAVQVLPVQPASIALSPQSKTLRIGTEHTLQATVLGEQGEPIPAGTEVTLEITGAHPASLTATTDSQGAASFRYTGSQAGSDQAVAHVAAISSNLAVIEWTLADSTPPVTTAALSPAEPDGTNGKYKSPVTITLTAQDDDSGVMKTEYRIDGGAWQTYAAAPFVVSAVGAHEVEYRSVDQAGNMEAAKKASFTIGGSKAPQAFFNPAGAGKNVALLEEGAAVAAVSSNYDSGHTAENMLKYSYHNPWATRSKANQWVKIALAGEQEYLIDRIQIRPRPSYAEQRVKEFEVAVSLSPEDGTFTTVLQAVAANNGELQEFKLPRPMPAKYILYKPISNYGDVGVTSTQQFKVKTGQIGGPTVKFQDLSTDEDNDIVSWQWDFGHDNAASTEKEPTHTFPGPGKYTVKLTVTDSEGNSSSSTLEQTVEPADFEFVPRIPKEGETVSFVNTTAGGDEGNITSTKWLFDNRATTTGMTPTRIYEDNGTYTIMMETTTKDGKVYQTTKTITTTNVAPTVQAGNEVTLRGGQRHTAGTYISDAGRLDTHSCLWDFGDGQTSTTCSFDHAYPVMEKDAPDKVYEAVVTVTDDDGGSATSSMKVTTRADRTPKPIAIYTFENNFQDSSGNGNHGKVAIGSPTFVEGIVGKAVKFDGRSGVIVEDHDSLDLSTAFTFSMWLYKEDAGTGWAPILAKGHTADYGPYAFLHESSGKSPGVRLVSGDRSGIHHLIPNTPVEFKQWYLSTITWDGSVIKYYVNGQLRATQSWTGVFKNTTEKLTIGYDPPGATEYFRGMMDDFRVYDYSLSDQEVSTLYDMKNPPADTQLPVTTAVTSSVYGADPANGWHRSDITLTLQAADNDSGVKQTEYRVNGGAWTVYAGPVVHTVNGLHQYEYRSIDKAGNIEAAKTAELKLDKAAPATLYHMDPIFAVNKLGKQYISGFTITLKAADPAGGSGLKTTMYRINGGAWTPYSAPFVATAGVTKTVEYYSTDLAGNQENPINSMDFVRGIYTGAGSF
jgi:PKD repeat protein